MTIEEHQFEATWMVGVLAQVVSDKEDQAFHPCYCKVVVLLDLKIIPLLHLLRDREILESLQTLEICKSNVHLDRDEASRWTRKSLTHMLVAKLG